MIINIKIKRENATISTLIILKGFNSIQLARDWFNSLIPAIKDDCLQSYSGILQTW